MKTQRASTQSGYGSPPHPLWVRLLTFFCMALLTMASTVQACHTHDELLHPGLAASSGAPSGVFAQPGTPANPAQDTNSAVSCPLCVAMHSALPVTHSLAHVGMLRVTPNVSAVETAERLFPWRFHLASRPPPAASPSHR